MRGGQATGSRLPADRLLVSLETSELLMFTDKLQVSST